MQANDNKMAGRGKNKVYNTRKGTADMVNKDGGQEVMTSEDDVEQNVSCRSKIMNKDMCGICKKSVTPLDKGLKCEYCGLWFHMQCDKMDEERYNFLSSSEKQVHWFCKFCDEKAIEVLLLVQGIKEKQDDLEVKYNELSQKVESIENLEGNFNSNIRSVIKEEIYETNEKEKRKSNIIIKNMCELEDGGDDNDDENGDIDNNKTEKRAKENFGIEYCTTEKEIAEHVVKNVLKVKDVKILQAERIEVNGSRRRPLRVRLEGKEQKFKVLNKSKQLRHITEYQNIFISPDMTYSEREKDKKLRIDLKERRKRGEKNLMIKNGVITQYREEARV